jgi:hypothetical protein
VEIEHDIICGGLADDANDLAFFHRESFAAVALHDRLAENLHAFLRMNLVLATLADRASQKQELRVISPA